MLLINNEVVAQILNIKGCMEALETGYRDLIDERAIRRIRRYAPIRIPRMRDHRPHLGEIDDVRAARVLRIGIG